MSLWWPLHGGAETPHALTLAAQLVVDTGLVPSKSFWGTSPAYMSGGKRDSKEMH